MKQYESVFSWPTIILKTNEANSSLLNSDHSMVQISDFTTVLSDFLKATKSKLIHFAPRADLWYCSKKYKANSRCKGDKHPLE